MTSPPNQSLDQMLEAVVIAAWDDLILAGTPGLVHIKYRLSDDHSLANLQVWVSETRGRWLLVCEYSGSGSAGASPRLAFSNEYSSELLTQFLTFVIEHQSAFDRTPELNRDSLVQIQLPNEHAKLRALKVVNEAQMLKVLPVPTTLAAAT